MTIDESLDRLVRFYETLERGTLPRVREVYSDGALFKDPFNEVRGHAAIIQVFEHMFEQVDQPRFYVTRRMAQDGDAFLLWEMRFRMRGKKALIRGASHVAFAADGRVSLHRDYWDAAEELYEKVPVLGALMRMLKRRLGAGA